jgi:hypothetical protein
MRTSLFVIGLALPLVLSCGGSTGGGRVSFRASASGAQLATGTSLEFTNGLGYHVVLTRARLHIGSIYLNQTVPSSGSQATACILPGIYVAQVLGALDVDALSPSPQPFPVDGEANAIQARAGELWLTGGDINTIDDTTPILNAAGTADRGSTRYPFEANITIGRNRLIPSSDPAFPSLNPICKQRIVSPIPIDLTPQSNGELRITVDPRVWFGAVEFSTLPRASDSPLLYRFADSAQTPADVNLYNGMHATQGAYQFTWQ